eukprot:scaffold125357_cov28-Tisochrysis_lutea.AAC.2
MSEAVALKHEAPARPGWRGARDARSNPLGSMPSHEGAAGRGAGKMTGGEVNGRRTPMSERATRLAG